MQKKSLFLVLAATLLISASAYGEHLSDGESTSCETIYKDAAGDPCIGIAGAGVATGCVSAGVPSNTNNFGRSSVTISWASPGTGKFSWNNVGGCVPSPFQCTYNCGPDTIPEPSDPDEEIIGGFASHLPSLYAAVTADQVMEALERIGTKLYQLPLGRNFNEALRERAMQELESLVGRRHVEAIATPYLLSIDRALDEDALLRQARDAK